MTEPQGAPAPVVTPPAAATPPAQGTPPESPDAGPPAWLAPRLAEAKKTKERELLTELGVASLAEGKAKLAKAAEAEQASMTEKERAEARIKELEPKAQQADEFKALFGQLVEGQFSALPEQARNAIDAVANGDPKQRWASMQLLASAGMQLAPAPTTAPTGTPAVALPVKTPATTVPAGTPLAPPRSSTPQSVHQQWEQLNATDPVGASVFRRLNAQRFREDAAVK